MSEPSKKRVRKTKTVRRREIAEAALLIMSRHGYYGTSVERIAKTVGISNSALYQHFRSREEMLAAAAELLDERSQEWILAQSGSSALERLDKIAESHQYWSAEALETFVRPIFAFVGVSEQARMEQTTPRSVKQSYDLLLPIVEEGQREGSIRTDVDPGDLVWAVLMFAWAEDMALLAKVDEVTTAGASRRNFVRLLSAYTPPEASEEAPAPTAL